MRAAAKLLTLYGGGRPAWVAELAAKAGAVPTVAVNFQRNEAWLNGKRVSIASLLTPATANGFLFNDIAWFNPAASTVFSHTISPVSPGVQNIAWQFAAAAEADGTAIELYDNTPQNVFVVFAGGFSVQAALSDLNIPDDTNKTATAFAEDDFARSFNGGAIAADISGTWPAATITRCAIGCNANGVDHDLGGTSLLWAYWNTRLADAALQALAA